MPGPARSEKCPAPNLNLERWHLKAGPCYIPGTTHAYLVGMEFRQSSCLAGGAIA